MSSLRHQNYKMPLLLEIVLEPDRRGGRCDPAGPAHCGGHGGSRRSHRLVLGEAARNRKYHGRPVGEVRLESPVARRNPCPRPSTGRAQGDDRT